MSERKSVLLLALDGGERDGVPASVEAAQKMQGARIAGHQVIAEKLPTALSAGKAVLANLLAKHRPTVTLIMTEAPIARLQLQRVALNLFQARGAEDFSAASEQKLITEALPAYFSTLPIRAISQTWQVSGVPGEIVLTRDIAAANAYYFWLLHWLSSQLPSAQGGCLLMPALPERAAKQRDRASMTLSLQLTGLEQLIQTTLSDERA